MRGANRTRPVASTTRQNPLTDFQTPRARTALTLPTFNAGSGVGFNVDSAFKLPSRASSQRIRHIVVGTSLSASVSLGTVNLSARNLVFWFARSAFANQSLKVDKATIHISSDNFVSTGVQMDFTPNSDAHLRDFSTFMPVEVPSSLGTVPIGSASPFGMPVWGALSGKSQPNWAAITHIKFGLTSATQSGSNSEVWLWLGGIEAIDKPREPVVTFAFDRFNKSNFNNAYPILAAKGWAGSMRGQVGQLIDLSDPSLMTLANAQTLYGAGWDIGVYDYPGTGFIDGGSNYSNWTTRSKAGVIADLRLAQQRLIENGMPAAVGQLAGQARKLYLDGYTDVVQPLFNYVDVPSNDELPAFWPPVDPMHVPNRMYVKSVDDADDAHGRIKQTIDRAIGNKEWLTLLFHDVSSSVVDGFTLTPTKFQDLVDYVSATGAKVRTTSQVMHGQV